MSVAQLETKVTGDVAQRLGGEVEGCGLGANALREIAKRVADLRIDVRDDAVLRWRASDMRKKSRFLSFKQEVLQKCRNSSRRARTERLAGVAQRGQEQTCRTRSVAPRSGSAVSKRPAHSDTRPRTLTVPH
jgi:hypothetical protein